MYRNTKISIALLVLLGSTAAQSAESGETTFEICKPSSAIRHEVSEKPELSQVRAASAHGTCRNASSAKRADAQLVLASATPETLYTTICKPNSAIRYRVAGEVDSGIVRTKNAAGSYRNP